eukprot:SAG11_NODE_431_length_9526_cov_11.297019_4_plen_194_part_00
MGTSFLQSDRIDRGDRCKRIYHDGEGQEDEEIRDGEAHDEPERRAHNVSYCNCLPRAPKFSLPGFPHTPTIFTATAKVRILIRRLRPRPRRRYRAMCKSFRCMHALSCGALMIHRTCENDSDQLPSTFFFKYNSALGPPYHVLVDTNFINFSIKVWYERVPVFYGCGAESCSMHPAAKDRDQARHDGLSLRKM